MQRVKEGLALRQEVCDSIEESVTKNVSWSDRCLFGEEKLLKLTQACVLLEDASVAEVALTYYYKSAVYGHLGDIASKLASLREAKRLFDLAATQVAENGPELMQITDDSMKMDIDIGKTLLSANQVIESEKCFQQVLSTPGLSSINRASCLDSLARLYDRKKDWIKLEECCIEGLDLMKAEMFTPYKQIDIQKNI